MAENKKKISKKTLNKSFNLWFWGALTCFSQEHMQTFGYLSSMLPIIKELYPDKKEQQEKIHAYTAFFNTNPMLGSVIIGTTASMEEARANGKGIDGETINDMRAGLMGPIAGIGDSLIDGTLIPILLGLALGMSQNGSPVGAISTSLFGILLLTLVKDSFTSVVINWVTRPFLSLLVSKVKPFVTLSQSLVVWLLVVFLQVG